MRRAMILPVLQLLLLLLATSIDYIVATVDKESICNLNTPTLPLHPQQITTPAGYHLYYLLPPSTKPQGVLIYLHGCGHSGHDFFLMPEERIIVQQALCSNLAILSLESSDRKWGCWADEDDALFWNDAEDEYGDGEDDYSQYFYDSDVVTKWMEYVKLPQSLPRYGMGVSSGASILLSGIVSEKILKLDAVASYIIYPGQVDVENMEKDFPPPTIFVHMPRDGITAQHVAYYVKKMQANDIDVKEYIVQPKLFDISRCVAKIPELGGEEKCSKLINHLIENYPNLLDPDTFEVKVGHKDERWLKAWNEIETELVGISGAIGSYKDIYFTGKMGDEEDNSEGQFLIMPELTFRSTPWIWACVLEEIGVCYAQHKITAEYLAEVLQFLTKHGEMIEDENNTLRSDGEEL